MEKKEMKHTPTPWKVMPYDPTGYSHDIVSNDFNEDDLSGIRIARTSDGHPSQANAEFIVLAVNSHEGLINELLEIKKTISVCKLGLEEDCLWLIMARIDKALAKTGVKV